jgi:prepilin-type processing-associated H-X9-DG protein
VREAAARAKCQNNLKQLALALHAYHDANQCFPQGNFGTSMSYSWFVPILPYVEAGAAYGQLKMDPAYVNAHASAWPAPDTNAAPVGQDNGPNKPLLTTFQTPVFVCPSNPMPPWGGVYNKHMQASYAGVAGSNPDFSGTNRCPGGVNNPDCYNGVLFAPKTVPASSNVITGRGDQMTPYPWNGITFGHITDGTSNVMVVGEQSSWGKRADTLAQNECRATGRFGWAIGGYGGNGGRRFNIVIVNRPLGTLVCDRPLTEGTSDLDSTTSFRSSHGPGANIAFADGSIRWLSDTIDFTLYRSLAIRDSGQVKALPN